MDLSRIPEPLRSKLKDQLDRLPSEVRGKLESQLAKLPAEQLEAVLARSAPMLERLSHKSGSAGGASVSTTSGARAPGSGMSGIAPSYRHVNDPHDHYNQTVRRGDIPMPPMVVMLACIAGLLSLLGVLGLLH